MGPRKNRAKKAKMPLSTSRNKSEVKECASPTLGINTKTESASSCSSPLTAAASASSATDIERQRRELLRRPPFGREVPPPASFVRGDGREVLPRRLPPDYIQLTELEKFRVDDEKRGSCNLELMSRYRQMWDDVQRSGATLDEESLEDLIRNEIDNAAAGIIDEDDEDEGPDFRGERDHGEEGIAQKISSHGLGPSSPSFEEVSSEVRREYEHILEEMKKAGIVEEMDEEEAASIDEEEATRRQAAILHYLMGAGGGEARPVTGAGASTSSIEYECRGRKNSAGQASPTRNVPKHCPGRFSTVLGSAGSGGCPPRLTTSTTKKSKELRNAKNCQLLQSSEGAKPMSVTTGAGGAAVGAGAAPSSVKSRDNLWNKDFDFIRRQGQLVEAQEEIFPPDYPAHDGNGPSRRSRSSSFSSIEFDEDGYPVLRSPKDLMEGYDYYEDVRLGPGGGTAAPATAIRTTRGAPEAGGGGKKRSNETFLEELQDNTGHGREEARAPKPMKMHILEKAAEDAEEYDALRQRQLDNDKRETRRRKLLREEFRDENVNDGRRVTRPYEGAVAKHEAARAPPPDPEFFAAGTSSTRQQDVEQHRRISKKGESRTASLTGTTSAPENHPHPAPEHAVPDEWDVDEHSTFLINRLRTCPEFPTSWSKLGRGIEIRRSPGCKGFLVTAGARTIEAGDTAFEDVSLISRPDDEGSALLNEAGGPPQLPVNQTHSMDEQCSSREHTSKASYYMSPYYPVWEAPRHEVLSLDSYHYNRWQPRGTRVFLSLSNCQYPYMDPVNPMRRLIDDRGAGACEFPTTREEGEQHQQQHQDVAERVEIPRNADSCTPRKNDEIRIRASAAAAEASHCLQNGTTAAAPPGPASGTSSTLNLNVNNKTKKNKRRAKNKANASNAGAAAGATRGSGSGTRAAEQRDGVPVEVPRQPDGVPFFTEDTILISAKAQAPDGPTAKFAAHAGWRATTLEEYAKGVFLTNALTAFNPETFTVEKVILPLVARMNHSCTPNCVVELKQQKELVLANTSRGSNVTVAPRPKRNRPPDDPIYAAEQRQRAPAEKPMPRGRPAALVRRRSSSFRSAASPGVTRSSCKARAEPETIDLREREDDRVCGLSDEDSCRAEDCINSDLDVAATAYPYVDLLDGDAAAEVGEESAECTNAIQNILNEEGKSRGAKLLEIQALLDCRRALELEVGGASLSDCERAERTAYHSRKAAAAARSAEAVGQKQNFEVGHCERAIRLFEQWAAARDRKTNRERHEKNAFPSHVGSPWVARVRALRRIEPGEELTISYVDFLHPFAVRKEQLRLDYHVDIEYAVPRPVQKFFANPVRRAAANERYCRVWRSITGGIGGSASSSTRDGHDEQEDDLAAKQRRQDDLVEWLREQAARAAEQPGAPRAALLELRDRIGPDTIRGEIALPVPPFPRRRQGAQQQETHDDVENGLAGTGAPPALHTTARTSEPAKAGAPNQEAIQTRQMPAPRDEMEQDLQDEAGSQGGAPPSEEVALPMTTTRSARATAAAKRAHERLRKRNAAAQKAASRTAGGAAAAAAAPVEDTSAKTSSRSAAGAAPRRGPTTAQLQAQPACSVGGNCGAAVNDVTVHKTAAGGGGAGISASDAFDIASPIYTSLESCNVKTVTGATQTRSTTTTLPTPASSEEEDRRRIQLSSRREGEPNFYSAGPKTTEQQLQRVHWLELATGRSYMEMILDERAGERYASRPAAAHPSFYLKWLRDQEEAAPPRAAAGAAAAPPPLGGGSTSPTPSTTPSPLCSLNPSPFHVGFGMNPSAGYFWPERAPVRDLVAAYPFLGLREDLKFRLPRSASYAVTAAVVGNDGQIVLQKPLAGHVQGGTRSTTRTSFTVDEDGNNLQLPHFTVDEDGFYEYFENPFPPEAYATPGQLSKRVAFCAMRAPFGMVRNLDAEKWPDYPLFAAAQLLQRVGELNPDWAMNWDADTLKKLLKFAIEGKMKSAVSRSGGSSSTQDSSTSSGGTSSAAANLKFILEAFTREMLEAAQDPTDEERSDGASSTRFPPPAEANGRRRGAAVVHPEFGAIDSALCAEFSAQVLQAGTDCCEQLPGGKSNVAAYVPLNKHFLRFGQHYTGLCPPTTAGMCTPSLCGELLAQVELLPSKRDREDRRAHHGSSRGPAEQDQLHPGPTQKLLDKRKDNHDESEPETSGCAPPPTTKANPAAASGGATEFGEYQQSWSCLAAGARTFEDHVEACYQLLERRDNMLRLYIHSEEERAVVITTEEAVRDEDKEIAEDDAGGGGPRGVLGRVNSLRGDLHALVACFQQFFVELDPVTGRRLRLANTTHQHNVGDDHIKSAAMIYRPPRAGAADEDNLAAGASAASSSSCAPGRQHPEEIRICNRHLFLHPYPPEHPRCHLGGSRELPMVRPDLPTHAGGETIHDLRFYVCHLTQKVHDYLSFQTERILLGFSPPTREATDFTTPAWPKRFLTNEPRNFHELGTDEAVAIFLRGLDLLEHLQQETEIWNHRVMTEIELWRYELGKYTTTESHHRESTNMAKVMYVDHVEARHKDDHPARRAELRKQVFVFPEDDDEKAEVGLGEDDLHDPVCGDGRMKTTGPTTMTTRAKDGEGDSDLQKDGPQRRTRFVSISSSTTSQRNEEENERAAMGAFQDCVDRARMELNGNANSQPDQPATQGPTTMSSAEDHAGAGGAPNHFLRRGDAVEADLPETRPNVASSTSTAFVDTEELPIQVPCLETLANRALPHATLADEMSVCQFAEMCETSEQLPAFLAERCGLRRALMRPRKNLGGATEEGEAAARSRRFFFPLACEVVEDEDF